MKRIYAAAGFVVSAAFAPVVFSQTGAVVAGSAPGSAGIAQTVKVTGTISAIDKSTRDVTLKGPQGNEVVVTAGPEVKNFDNMKVGDQVTAQYVEALAVELKKGGGMTVGRSDQGGVRESKPGQKPGGVAGRQVTIVADVVDTNPATQTIKLRGPKHTVEVRVADPEQFKRVSKGDQVEATYTQALAIAVGPAAK